MQTDTPQGLPITVCRLWRSCPRWASAGEAWPIDTKTEIETDTVVDKVTVCNHPAHVVVPADGRWVCVTNGGGNTPSVVDTAALKVTATVSAEIARWVGGSSWVETENQEGATPWT